jgi:hypothetical protein
MGLLGIIFNPLVRWTVLGIGALFVLAWIVTFVSVKTSDIEVTNISEVSLEGMTVEATLNIENGGILPVEIESVTYTITIDDTNYTVSKGAAEGFTLGSNEVSPVPMNMKVSWDEAGMKMTEVLLKESIPATIKAQVRVQPIYIITIPVPVKQSIDLGTYTQERTGTRILDKAVIVDQLLS